MIRHAFTVIEVLVAVLIVSILVAMLLPAIDGVREASRKAQTGSTINLLANAFGSAAAASGSSLASSEHPLAGSASPRSKFMRTDAAAARNSADEALDTLDPSWLGTFVDRYLGPDDRFAGVTIDGDLPLLFGVPRRKARIPGATIGPYVESGANRPGVTAYRNVPRPPPGQKEWAKVDKTALPDAMSLMAPPGPTSKDISQPGSWERIQTESIAQLLSSAAGGSIADNGAVKSTTKGVLTCNDRIYLTSMTGESNWKPGAILLGGVWRPYGLRGGVLVDAWGRELLVWSTRSGIAIESAGRDGVFRFHPGMDGVYQTGAVDDQPSGDDRDGSLDNINNRYQE